MNKEENINKIKESLKRMFSTSVATEIVEQKFESVVLSDGSKVMIDKLEKDGIVTLEDGTFPTAGELTLEDGRVIIVGENGVIAEVKEVEVDETPVEEAQVENAEVAEVESPEEEVIEEDKVALLEARIAKLEEAMATMTMSNEEMSQKVIELSAQPADESVIVEKRFAKVDKTDVNTEILKLRARNKNK